MNAGNFLKYEIHNLTCEVALIMKSVVVCTGFDEF